DEPLEPAKLVIKFRAGCGVAVRQIEAANDHDADRRLDITALRIVRIAGKSATGLHGGAAASEDRHAVPALLPMPDRAIAGVADRRLGAFLLWRLQLLQADDVRPGFA